MQNKNTIAIGLLLLLGMSQLSLAATKERVVELFDGKSLDGWTTQAGKPVTEGWVVEDGMLVRKSRGGPIYPDGEFGDFELSFEWKIAPRGNGGVKYGVAFYKKGVWGRPGWLGCEYQLFDDAGRGTKAETSAGSIYGLYAPNDKKKLKPTGEFNSSKIVVRGTKIEHWLNGEKIVEADTSSDDWKKRVAKSKFGKVDGFFENDKGRIQIQDHGSGVWLRNIEMKVFNEE